MHLFLIDAIGPFFRGYDWRTINWSKIPFAHLALDGPHSDAQWARIREDLETFCAAVLMRRKRGYRAIDRLLTLNGLSLIYRIIAKRRPQWIPAFAKESAIGVDTVFR
jgi:hypothetical protein